MQQYRDAKERHPGMLLLFRVGDFYELFDEDARTAAKVIGLTLTSRDKTTDMADFPHHSLETHLRKFVSLGHRVAVCDQVVEVPGRHEVTRVIVQAKSSDDTADELEEVIRQLASDDVHADVTAIGWKQTSIPVKLRKVTKGAVR